jgi:indolepyruvate ferredoxin oxidoreductase, beta subunit
MNKVTNIVIAGLGGQGVLKASDILAEAALRGGWEVKKSELHGMSQRGGSVTSDVRFGKEVWSPMVPIGEADYLMALATDQVEPNRHYLRSDSVLVLPEQIAADLLANRKSLNVALLGRLSQYLPIMETDWQAAIRAHLPEKLHAVNLEAFKVGRQGK